MNATTRDYVKALRHEAAMRRKEAMAQLDLAAAKDNLADVIEREDEDIEVPI